MGFDLFGMDSKFQTEWVAVAPRWVATKGHHFKYEGVVAMDLDDRVTAAWQCSDDRLEQRVRIDQEIADLAASDDALAIVLVVHRLADGCLERCSQLSSAIYDLTRCVLGEF